MSALLGCWAHSLALHPQGCSTYLHFSERAQRQVDDACQTVHRVAVERCDRLRAELTVEAAKIASAEASARQVRPGTCSILVWASPVTKSALEVGSVALPVRTLLEMHSLPVEPARAH